MIARLSEIAEITSGTIVSLGRYAAEAKSAYVLTGLASLSDAQPTELAFFNNERYADDLRQTSAGAVLIDRKFDINGLIDVPSALLAVDDPSIAFAQVGMKLVFVAETFDPGIDPTAIVDSTVQLDENAVSIGPNVVIESGTTVEDGTRIEAGCIIGKDSRIGRACRLHANVTLYRSTVLGDRVELHSGVVIGADGFGYEKEEDGRYRKVDQIGFVQLDDDVEV